MSDGKITFELHGDNVAIAFDPADYTDCPSQTALESQLLELAEDNASFGLTLTSTGFGELWAQVERAREAEQALASSSMMTLDEAIAFMSGWNGAFDETPTGRATRIARGVGAEVTKEAQPIQE